MNNPFEHLGQWLKKNSITADEKRAMRTKLVYYATTHPVKSGLFSSPYAFRYATAAFASLLLVLGGSVGLTAAAGRALPNDSLYSFKVFIEEYRAKNQTTPDAKIAFETKRIETRFDEATKLAIAHKLDDATSAVIQAGIEHSRGVVKSAADQVQTSNPELALSATNTLETAFTSNGKILAAIERNTNQQLGTIVLAAQVTTENLATEKTKYEQIVAMKPNDTTQAAAEAKLAKIEALLAAEAPIEAPSTNPSPTLPKGEGVATVPTTEPDPTVPVTVDPMLKIAPEPMALALMTPPTEVIPVEPKSEPTARELVAQAKEKMAAGQYSEALVILGQAEQLMNEKTLTESLEKTYQVETDAAVAAPVKQ